MKFYEPLTPHEKQVLSDAAWAVPKTGAYTPYMRRRAAMVRS